MCSYRCSVGSTIADFPAPEDSKFLYNANQHNVQAFLVISSLREHYCISFDFQIRSGGGGELGMATRGV